jgi:hypothetical protein
MCLTFTDAGFPRSPNTARPIRHGQHRDCCGEDAAAMRHRTDPRRRTLAPRAPPTCGLTKDDVPGEEAAGYSVVVDEWESPEGFQAFVGDPEFQGFTASVGASGAPEVWIGGSISSPDEY